MFDLTAILGGLPDAVVLLSPTGDVLWANTAAEELLDDKLAAWIGRNVLEAVHPDDHAIVINACTTVANKPVGALLSVRMQRSSGALFAVELRGRQMMLADGEILVIVIRRIDDRDGLELVGNEATMLHRLVHHSPAILAVLDDALNLVSVNAALTRLLGYDSAVVCGRSFLELVDVPERKAVEYALAHIEGAVRRSVSLRTLSGETRYFDLHATDLRAEHAVGRIVVSMSDITELRVAEQDLRTQADNDPLTGLLNTRSFESQLDRIATASCGEIGVMFVDVDQFKLINDVYGHHTGDYVLMEIANRLRSLCGDESLIARVGGDEFVIALHGGISHRTAALAGEIATCIARPVSLIDAELCVRVSIGVAVAQTPCNTRALIDQADRRMYEIKRQQLTHSHGSAGRFGGTSRLL